MELLAGILCLAVASVIGGATGFGSALIGTPLMLLVGVDVGTAVVMNLAAGVATRVVVSIRLRGDMDRPRVRRLCAGAAPGAVAGLAVVSFLPGEGLRVFAGIATVVCGVWLALPGGAAHERTPGAVATVATGLLGGFLTTTTSLGGPPPVLLLQWARVAPMTFIADLAGYFVVTSGIGLALLVAGGRLPVGLPWWAWFAFGGAALLGNAIGIRLARRMPREAFRRAVIALVVLAGVATIVF